MIGNHWWCVPNTPRKETRYVENHPTELEDNSDYATELKPVQDYSLVMSRVFPTYKYLLTLSNGLKILFVLLSYIFRFIYNFRNAEQKEKGRLLDSDLQKDEVYLKKQLHYI